MSNGRCYKTATVVFIIVACCAFLLGNLHVPRKQQLLDDTLIMLQAQVIVEAARTEASHPPVVIPVVMGACGLIIVAMGIILAGLGHDPEQTVEKRDDKKQSAREVVSNHQSMIFIVNMVADVAPLGFLPVASGIKFIGFVPSFVCMFIVWLVCVYTMWMTARNCQIWNSWHLDHQWAMAIGKRTSWVPILANALACFGDNLAMTCFIGSISLDAFAVVDFQMSRTQCVILFSVFPILPLCFLKDLSTLAPSSTLGVISIFYTVAVMMFRAGDGSYHEGGQYYRDLTNDGLADFLPLLPANHHLFGFTCIACLKLVSTLSLSFMTHYNACKYYSELKSATPESYAKLTAIALGICASFYAISMIAGYVTFGYHAQEMILNNYAPEDVLITIARFGTGISLIVAYPVTFCGLRESAVSMLKMLLPSTTGSLFDSPTVQDRLTMFLVLLITITAVFLTDDGLMVGLVGSICGSAVIFVVPTLIHIFAMRKGFASPKLGILQSSWPRLILVCGAFLMIAGTIETFRGSANASAAIATLPPECREAAHHHVHMFTPWYFQHDNSGAGQLHRRFAQIACAHVTAHHPTLANILYGFG